MVIYGYDLNVCQFDLWGCVYVQSVLTVDFYILAMDECVDGWMRCILLYILPIRGVNFNVCHARCGFVSWWSFIFTPKLTCGLYNDVYDVNMQSDI